MALEIVWTPRAEQGFKQIIDYLKENWTEREVQNFIQKAFRLFELLSEHPEILEKSDKQKNVHRGAIDRHTILTYRIWPEKHTIELVNIRSAKRKPLKR
jgi:plasmid stabilization system protein ParE